MKICCTPELRDYMTKKNKHTIVVEKVDVNNTDLEITELHVHFTDARGRTVFLEKKGYRATETDFGEILFPRYPLEFADTVTFGLKSFLFYKYITYTGIKL